MSSLPTPLRRQLESAVKQARKVAAEGARKALEALAVHEADPYAYMGAVQIELRRKLRAQAAQLGDKEVLGKPGSCEIKHLVEKLAYDQWHRLLFARYLVENNLLISPEHGVSVSLDDCEELAPSLGLKDSWAVAARFAAKELPEIFRADDPAGAVELPAENRKPLIQLVTGLPVEVFTAGDSLGWCYQFWQAERKDEVNAAGNKIGADELPAVTQLFTEDYMVDFLLDNTLGAWHAGKWLAAHPSLAETAQSEEELRAAVALPGCPWSYLRLIKGDDGKWAPAAGTFAGWPKTAKEVTCLDPCMGSGHFVVAIFERMVALRMEEESLEEPDAIAAVIRDNIFGLEIDPRCTQIAAFTLALAAWRRCGHRALPVMNLACSGLAPNAKPEDWLKLAGNDDQLRNGMDRLYRLFQHAPILGSLIETSDRADSLLIASFADLKPLLEIAISKEDTATSHEIAITAGGLTKAAEVMSKQYYLLATNVPFLGRGRQSEQLHDFSDAHFKEAADDLAQTFFDRSVRYLKLGGSMSLVAPQKWTFASRYKQYRMRFLSESPLDLVGLLGTGAFRTISGEVVDVGCFIVTCGSVDDNTRVAWLDESQVQSIDKKAAGLVRDHVLLIKQTSMIANQNSIVRPPFSGSSPLLGKSAMSVSGLLTGDGDRYGRRFWELPQIEQEWEWLQSVSGSDESVDGLSNIIFWERGNGELAALALKMKGTNHVAQNWRRGQAAWGKRGVAISATGKIRAALYTGERFEAAVTVIVPNKAEHLEALWRFCKSADFSKSVKHIDNKLAITTATLLNVPFDLSRWQVDDNAGCDMPEPFSIHPSQWVFSGGPKASESPLQVSAARMLGYQWPRQTGTSFRDCPAIALDGLDSLADGDGIVCLSATKGEPAAAERLRGLLAQAYGEDWSASVQQDLLAQVGYAGKTLDDWLRDAFFEQHCALFHHRPFLWHIWDGNKNGFSALVNYHKLNYATLESLTYSYLGLWIQRQQAAVDSGEAGSDARLQAAKQLQDKLKLILEGEPPYDLFVRWKPLSNQAIGWHPDLNDGVRMNIRPFATADILRKRVKIKWDKDRGKEPVREQKDFPWFWNWDGKTEDFAGAGTEPDGNRWNDLHYSNEAKRKARGE
jgi:hypothetical protein